MLTYCALFIKHADTEFSQCLSEWHIPGPTSWIRKHALNLSRIIWFINTGIWIWAQAVWLRDQELHFLSTFPGSPVCLFEAHFNFVLLLWLSFEIGLGPRQASSLLCSWEWPWTFDPTAPTARTLRSQVCSTTSRFWMQYPGLPACPASTLPRATSAALDPQLLMLRFFVLCTRVSTRYLSLHFQTVELWLLLKY